MHNRRTCVYAQDSLLLPQEGPGLPYDLVQHLVGEVLHGTLPSADVDLAILDGHQNEHPILQAPDVAWTNELMQTRIRHIRVAARTSIPSCVHNALPCTE